MQQACAVLDSVWEIPPGQTSEIQPHLLRALGHGGNYLVGAYEPGGSMVGASVAFFTEPLGSAMHSHITAVLRGGGFPNRLPAQPLIKVATRVVDRQLMRQRSFAFSRNCAVQSTNPPSPTSTFSPPSCVAISIAAGE